MVDIAVTTSEVLPGTGGRQETYIAAAVITPGQACSVSGGRASLAQADDTAASAQVKGIAVTGATAIGQPVILQTNGSVTIGATAALTVGETYVLSATAGGITTDADLVTDDYVTVIGVATAAGVLAMGSGPLASGAQVP